MATRSYHNQKALVFAVVAAIVLIFVAVYNFLAKVDEDIREDMRVQTEAIQKKSVSEIENEFNNIMRINLVAAQLMETSDFSEATDLVKYYAVSSEATHVMLLTESGRVYSNKDIESGDIALEHQEAIFNSADERPFLSPWVSDVAGEVCYGISTKLIFCGEKSVLTITYPVSKFYGILSNEFLGGKSGIGIIRKDGFTILGQKTEDGLNQYGLDIIAQMVEYNVPFVTGSAKQIQSDMAEGRSGFATYYLNDIERYCSYAPVAGSDWYIMVMTQESVLNTSIGRMASHGIFLTGFLVVIMTGLLVFIVLLRHRENKSIQLALKEAATIDGLTGILNRGTVENMIIDFLHNEGKERRHGFVVIDIDDFKSVNDKYGHVMGDAALQVLARRLEKCFYPTDLIGRMGGDEFLVLVKDIENDDILIERAKQLVEPFICVNPNTGEAAQFTISVGISFYKEDGESFIQLYQNADKALYHIKGSGKNSYSFYDKSKDD